MSVSSLTSNEPAVARSPAPNSKQRQQQQQQQQQRQRMVRQRRKEREEWLNQWARIWTKRQSPEWKPRRASVATCQMQQHLFSHQQYHQQDHHHHQFTTTNYDWPLEELSPICSFADQQCVASQVVVPPVTHPKTFQDNEDEEEEETRKLHDPCTPNPPPSFSSPYQWRRHHHHQTSSSACIPLTGPDTATIKVNDGGGVGSDQQHQPEAAAESGRDDHAAADDDDDDGAAIVSSNNLTTIFRASSSSASGNSNKSVCHRPDASDGGSHSASSSVSLSQSSDTTTTRDDGGAPQQRPVPKGGHSATELSQDVTLCSDGGGHSTAATKVNHYELDGRENNATASCPVSGPVAEHVAGAATGRVAVPAAKWRNSSSPERHRRSGGSQSAGRVRQQQQQQTLPTCCLAATTQPAPSSFGNAAAADDCVRKDDEAEEEGGAVGSTSNAAEEQEASASGAAAVSQKLELQDKQRKFLILSMALKRMVSEGSLVSECHKCRSPSVHSSGGSGGSGNSSRQTTPTPHRAALQRCQLEQSALGGGGSGSRGVLNSSRSMLIDQLLLAGGAQTVTASTCANQEGGGGSSSSSKAAGNSVSRRQTVQKERASSLGTAQAAAAREPISGQSFSVEEKQQQQQLENSGDWKRGLGTVNELVSSSLESGTGGGGSRVEVETSSCEAAVTVQQVPAASIAALAPPNNSKSPVASTKSNNINTSCNRRRLAVCTGCYQSSSTDTSCDTPTGALEEAVPSKESTAASGLDRVRKSAIFVAASHRQQQQQQQQQQLQQPQTASNKMARELHEQQRSHDELEAMVSATPSARNHAQATAAVAVVGHCAPRSSKSSASSYRSRSSLETNNEEEEEEYEEEEAEGAAAEPAASGTQSFGAPSGDELNFESLIVESWLDDHPAFVHDYLMRKASRQLIDDWLVAHAKAVSNTNLSSQFDLNPIAVQSRLLSRPVSQQSLNSHLHNLGLRADSDPPPPPRMGSMSFEPPSASMGSGQSSATPTPTVTGGTSNGAGAISSRPARSNSQSSGSLAPVRKISATDFESRHGSALLRPMVSTTPDGRPTFLSQPNNNNNNGTYGGTISDDVIRGNHRARGSTAAAAARQPRDSRQQRGGAAERQASGQEGDQLDEDHRVGSNDIFTDDDDDDDGCQPTGNSTRDGGGGGGGDVSHDHDEDEGDGVDGQDDEVKLIFELVKNICNDLDIRTLLHKILKNIAVLINADKSSLFLVCGEPGDPNRHLVSQLFNVDQDDSVELSGAAAAAAGDEASTESAAAAADSTITIPWGTGLVGYVAESGESLNIANCYEDPRFTNTIDQRTGYVTRHMLCAPIFDKRNEIVGVAQVINKRDGNPFSKGDEIKFKRYLQFCGIGLRNAQSYEHCQLENRRNQVLLDLARMVFEEQSTIEQVVYRIMLHTQSLLECQRCQVLLIDDGSDDLDQLLQLPVNQSSATVGGTVGRQQQQTAATTTTTTGDGGGNGGSTKRPAATRWRPHCNTIACADGRQSGGDGDDDEVDIDDGDDEEDDEDDDNDNDDDDDGSEPMTTQEDYRQPEQQQSSKLFSLVFDLECDGNDLVMHSNKADDSPNGDADDNDANSDPDQQQQGQKFGSTGAGGVQSTTTIERSRRFPINIGITGYVAMTGETLNIEDVHQSERFDPQVDEGSNFRHKSILCMPIRNGQHQIIGVSQLINKKNGRPFNKNDEDLFEAFAIFCGLGIHNTLMYERVLKIMAKQRVTFEVLSYHATAPVEEAKKLNMEQIPSCFALNLTSLKFNDFSLDDQFMLKSCLRFFLDLDLIRRFQIDQLVFCNWILSVQKNYRKVTYHPIVGGNGRKAAPVRYHNWRHAFNVSQMMFAILVNTQICQALGELETLALLIACLCHDLDHRGTNNSFQIKSASPLAELYSTSTMEHHHFDQCVMILNSQGNQILANLSPEEYSRVIVLLKEAILATDLANYFHKRELFFQLVNSNQFEWHNNPEHRSLLRCMLMTACDVAAITKPWPVQKVVADLVMSEFYQQGDIEKHELNIEPIDMMNREKMSKLPEMQIGFIDSICAPIYSAFARLFPHELGSLLEGCLSNRNLWAELAKSNAEENNHHSDQSITSYLNNNNNSTPTIHILPKQNTNATTTTNNNNNNDDTISLSSELHECEFLAESNRLDSGHSLDASCSLGSELVEPRPDSDCERHASKVDCQRKSV